MLQVRFREPNVPRVAQVAPPKPLPHGLPQPQLAEHTPPERPQWFVAVWPSVTLHILLAAVRVTHGGQFFFSCSGNATDTVCSRDWQIVRARPDRALCQRFGVKWTL